ncbi:Werner syndrome-like exonuclease-like protein [Thalictrum thalictroides]|uniref:Werner syndrome-like exonuclease-like protein n=1 Tax=Thalictrum thalictroides TaxID=46969 RepID=A0A7J6WDE2_THATH|nr:Werner syndrome-like exonuclease-like protein [Thalictrum thalictroides]
MALAAIVINESELDTELCKFIPLLNSSVKDDPVKSVVGLAIELSYKSKVPVLALWSRNHGVIVHLLHFESIPTSLFNFLSLSEITFVGIQIKDSIARLKRDYGLECRNATDLGQLAAAVLEKPYLSCCGLQHLSFLVLGFEWSLSDSTVITSPWNALDLKEGQVKKVGTSAHFSFSIGNKLLGGSYIDKEMEAIVSKALNATG